MKRQFMLIALSVFLCLTLNAQNELDRLMKVVPPSPTVASLGKYGEIPVGLYTGVPDISVPIYEITDGALDLPITLSYHAGGIKVEEVAPSVGLGWTLNAGGIVGRNVRGLPDEMSSWLNGAPENDLDTIMKTNNRTSIEDFVKAVDRGEKDGEPDLFYYNFNQFSGKFFFDQRGNVHSVPMKNILIKRVPEGWSIIVEDGTVYTFTRVETVRSAYCGGDQSTESAWFLTSIKTPDGKREISFVYRPVMYTYQTLIGQTKYFSANSTGAACLQNQPPCVGSQNYTTYKLVQINFRGGHVKFDYNNQRCDLPEDTSLDRISVYAASGQLIKSYALGYGYFGDSNDGCNYYTKDLKRLKLLSVTEENGPEENSPYAFTYNEAIELPGRFSYAQDHWGFYNGKVNNPDLIATFKTVVWSGNEIVFQGADRRPNPETSQAAILTKIKYPTGGETLFTYENNTVSDGEADPLPAVRTESITFNAYNVFLKDLPEPYESSELIVPQQGAEVKFYISGFASGTWQNCDIDQCVIIKDNNPVPFGRLEDSWNGVIEKWPAGVYKLRLIRDCNVDAKANFNVYITADIPGGAGDVPDIRPVGGLRIKMIEDRPGNGIPGVVKKYRYNLENDPDHSSGVLLNFPDYGYDLSVQNVKRDDGGSPFGPATFCLYRVRQSFSNYPLATTQGSYVGYSNVIVDLGDGGETWYTFEAHPNYKGSFPFAPVESHDWSRGFLLEMKDYSKKDGQLTLVREVVNEPYSFNETTIHGLKTGRDELYLDGNGAPYLQPLPKYTYYQIATECYELIETRERVYDQQKPDQYIEHLTSYTYNPGHLQLATSKVTTSISNAAATEELVTNRKYPFDYRFNGPPSGEEAKAIQKLQDLHMASTIIEEYTVRQNKSKASGQVVDQRVIGGTVTSYKADSPYPSQIFKLETSLPISLSTYGNGSSIRANVFVKNIDPDIERLYKPAVEFSKYDEVGNILTEGKVGEPKRSYLWGYQQKYPIAEVVGFDHTIIRGEVTLDDAVLQNPSAADGDIQGEINKIRMAFPTALVTTFTYKPLVGVSTQSDANNRRTFYEYDNLGRLSLIRDHDRNIIKKICYNYPGQPGKCAIGVQVR